MTYFYVFKVTGTVQWSNLVASRFHYDTLWYVLRT